MPDTLNVTMRPVRLFDATWQVLDHPRGVSPTFETIHSEGYDYPATDTVTCRTGHTRDTVRDWRGVPQLPYGVQRRYRAEVFDTDCGYDPYWVCSLCGAEVDITWAHTGPISFTTQVGEELSPSDEITLQMVDGPPGSFTVATTLNGAYELQDADGAGICQVVPDEMRYENDTLDFLHGGTRVAGQATIVLTARIIGLPRESLAALLQALYGGQAAALT